MIRLKYYTAYDVAVFHLADENKRRRRYRPTESSKRRLMEVANSGKYDLRLFSPPNAYLRDPITRLFTLPFAQHQMVIVPSAIDFSLYDTVSQH